jgi:hypothetical protein
MFSVVSYTTYGIRYVIRYHGDCGKLLLVRTSIEEDRRHHLPQRDTIGALDLKRFGAEHIEIEGGSGPATGYE